MLHKVAFSLKSAKYMYIIIKHSYGSISSPLQRNIEKDWFMIPVFKPVESWELFRSRRHHSSGAEEVSHLSSLESTCINGFSNVT